MLPVLYCLLTSKAAATYERLFRSIKNFWPAFYPESVSMDFEIGAIGKRNFGVKFCGLYLRCSQISLFKLLHSFVFVPPCPEYEEES